jgi:hypothetical protein
MQVCIQTDMYTYTQYTYMQTNTPAAAAAASVKLAPGLGSAFERLAQA